MSSKKSEKISKHIKNVAFHLFLEKGYEGTNLREIAATAGYKAPSLYFYYSSKEELFLNILDSVWEYHLDLTKTIISKKSYNTDKENLKEMFINQIECISKDYAVYQFLFRYYLFPANEIADKIREKYMLWEAKEKDMIIDMLNTRYNSDGSEKKLNSIFQHYIKTLRTIINETIVSGEFIDDNDLEFYWNKLCLNIGA